MCPQAQFGGYTVNGGFAEYVLADPDYVAHVPAGLACGSRAVDLRWNYDLQGDQGDCDKAWRVPPLS